MRQKQFAFIGSTALFGDFGVTCVGLLTVESSLVSDSEKVIASALNVEPCCNRTSQRMNLLNG